MNKLFSFSLFCKSLLGLSFIDSESLVTYVEDSPRAGPDISVWNGSLRFFGQMLENIFFCISSIDFAITLLTLLTLLAVLSLLTLLYKPRSKKGDWSGIGWTGYPLDYYDY